MDVDEGKFYFPHEPYKIQTQFMEGLYQVLENGGVGLFQSPTGTGKTMSIICGSLKWLTDREKALRTLECDEENESEASDGPDWLRCQLIEKNQEKLQTKLGEKQKILADIDFHNNMIRQPHTFLQPSDRHFSCSSTEFYCENQIDALKKFKTEKVKEDTYIDEIKKYIAKIYYCSRTHSQLSQFIDQLNHTKYNQTIRCSSLASRQLLCIHPKVNRIKNSQIIYDKCKKYREKKKCKYVLGDNQRLTDDILTQPLDIEDIVKKGACYEQCPYYASRKASIFSQLIALPYQSIFSQESRNALKIDIEKNILIIDEAHNLISTLEATNSIKISYNQLLQSKTCFDTFLESKRTNFDEILNVSQLKMICDALITLSQNSISLTVSEFFSHFDLENVNIVKLDDFCCKTRFISSLTKFFYKMNIGKSSQCIFLFNNMISGFRNSSPSDKILSNDQFVTFLCLDTAFKFKKLVTGCRSIIIVGGTLEPLSEFKDFLITAGFESQKIISYDFDHILPAANLLSLVVKVGSSNKELIWSFSNKDDEEMIKNLCLSFFNLCGFIPHGLICFFPSYNMQNIFIDVLKKSGLFSKINEKKRIIIEKRDDSTQEIFDEFEKHVHIKTGAILFSVMGGRLSEGINFSDKLCRGICIMGMPYGNMNDPEFKLKMDYYREYHDEKSTNDHYQNLCMSVVNQSIGRAIRHKSDYAAIILMDSRYSRPPIYSKLPKWIKNNTKILPSFGQTIPTLKEFFKQHSNQ